MLRERKLLLAGVSCLLSLTSRKLLSHKSAAHTRFSFPASEGIGTHHKALSNQIWADDTENKVMQKSKSEQEPFKVKVLWEIQGRRFKAPWFAVLIQYEVNLKSIMSSVVLLTDTS